MAHRFYGRTQIFTDETEITRDNVISVVQKAMNVHSKNRGEIAYLYKYYKGIQPVYNRKKEIRPEICNRIVENWANKIVSFKVGYICGSPIQYTSSNTDENISPAINLLNKYMDGDSKASKDRDLFEWLFICGTSYRMALPSEEEGERFNTYILDPHNTMVVYSNDYRKKPMAGITYATYRDNGAQIKTFSVYTDKKFFEIKDDKIVREEDTYIGIPIIEYPANNSRLGSFEIVLDLLDAINNIDSNRLDAVEQFIQSLVVVYNATLDGMTANEIREKGLIELKAIGENKGDIKILSEELNQDQTQTLKEDLIQRVREIVGLPSQGDGTTGDSSNNGAQLLKGGWEDAETRAKATELIFHRSEVEFLKLILKICSYYKNNELNLSINDIGIQFTRRNYENLQVKSQVLTTMLASDKIAPKLAFQSCGLFTDSEEAYRESEEYYESVRRTEQSNNGVDEESPAGNNEEGN